MKSKSISLRLSTQEAELLDRLSQNAQMNQSEYIRALISRGEQRYSADHRQLVGAMLGKLYVLLVQKGLNDEDITKEIMHLCQIL